MKTIQTMDELKENMATLEGYLRRKAEPEYSFALQLVKKGVCFAAVKEGQGYQFYPSRFIGYLHNTMDKHENNTEKDGKETTPAISKILGHRPEYDSELEKAYRACCERLGFTANEKGTFGVERKYWRI